MVVCFVIHSSRVNRLGNEPSRVDLLIDAARDSGLTVHVKCWDDPNVPWKLYQLLILTSFINYVPYVSKFRKWIQLIDELKVPTLNKIPALLWNIDKRYMLDFEKNGIEIPETIFLPKGCDDVTLKELLKAKNWAYGVIKPCIGAGGYDTWLVKSRHITQEDEIHFQSQLKKQSLMLQAFSESIRTEGELSCIFIDNELTHCVRKKCGENEFRVQKHHGGTWESVPLNSDLIVSLRPTFEKVLESAPVKVTQVRLDFVFSEGGNVKLLEFEALDAAIYPSSDPELPKKYATAIHKILTKNCTK